MSRFLLCTFLLPKVIYGWDRRSLNFNLWSHEFEQFSMLNLWAVLLISISSEFSCSQIDYPFLILFVHVSVQLYSAEMDMSCILYHTRKVKAVTCQSYFLFFFLWKHKMISLIIKICISKYLSIKHSLNICGFFNNLKAIDHLNRQNKRKKKKTTKKNREMGRVIFSCNMLVFHYKKKIILNGFSA